MEPSREQPLSLSPHRTFVVQFDATTAVDTTKWVGRVEHVVSGQATHFGDMDTLFAFMAKMLSQPSLPTR